MPRRASAAETQSRSARTPPSSPGRMTLWSPPQPQPRGQLPDFARLSVALAEENGVGHTYLGEFGAHHQEDQEAEELPGRLHVSRPVRRPSVRGLGAGGWRLRGRGRAPGWGWGWGSGRV